MTEKANIIDHHNECMICAKPLIYTEEAQNMNCAICGARYMSNAACEAGHYICDECHGEAGIIAITAYALNTDSDNPIAIAQGMMRDSAIHMHGPEHHFLVPAALLAAYANAGGKIVLSNALRIARQRAKNVPGGICGLWGTCGAAIGAGIFTSIVTEATPLSVEEWRLSNLATSRCLANIAENGGPRCCKRDSFLAISTMLDFTAEYLGIEMSRPEKLYCGFFADNKQCRFEDCLYYSQKG